MSDSFDPYYKWLGIAPSERPPTHYRLLGLRPFEPDRDVIASAVDRQMAHLRTFQSGARSNESQKLLNEIAAASVCLLRADTKAAYDAELKAQIAAKQPRPPAPPKPKAHAPATPPRVVPVATAPVSVPSHLATELSVERPKSRPRPDASFHVLPFAIAGVVTLSLALVAVWAMQNPGSKPASPAKRTAAKENQPPRNDAATVPESPSKMAKLDELPRQFLPPPPVEDLVPRNFSASGNASTSPPSRQLEAPPQPANVRIIDNGDSGYREIGADWRPGRGVGYRNGYRAVDSLNGASRAEWTFAGLKPGRKYRFHATWAAGTNRSKNAAYRVFGTTNTSAERVVNQRDEPADLQTGAVRWADLGEHIPTGDSLTVELSGPDDGPVIADAVRMEELPE